MSRFPAIKRRGGDSNPRRTERPLPVFETGAFNRSATSPGAADNKLEHRRAGPRRASGCQRREAKNARSRSAHSSASRPDCDLGAVVEPRLGQHVEHAAGGARLGVGGAEHDARDPGEHDRPGAHRARLERDVEHGVEHAPAAERCGRPRAGRSSRRGRSGRRGARARCGRRRSPRRPGRRRRRPGCRRARARARPRAAPGA